MDRVCTAPDRRGPFLSGLPTLRIQNVFLALNRKLFACLLCLAVAGAADTVLLEGTGLTRTLKLKSQDVVKLEAVDNTLTLQGSGDLLHLDGSDNRVELQGSLNGIVITGSGNQLTVKGDLKQLDVRGCDNRILLEGGCQLIQYGGSDNVTRWRQSPGRKPPKVERIGWNNLFEVLKP